MFINCSLSLWSAASVHHNNQCYWDCERKQMCIYYLEIHIFETTSDFIRLLTFCCQKQKLTWIFCLLHQCTIMSWMLEKVKKQLLVLVPFIRWVDQPAHCCTGLLTVINDPVRWRKLKSLSLSRWLLPLQHHQTEAHHPLCSLPAAEPTPRGALRPLAALLAGHLFPERCGGGSGGWHDLHSCPGTVLLLYWL